ncbi:hypothetical protein [Dietzia kunjamensis]|uniref:hypothetical protein n=1 Tax=Dietzia kunjamensis TaxID=322509 RepID=UPI0039BCB204
MTAQPERRALELPTRGAPSDWHWFRAKRAAGPRAGDVALCGYTLAGPVGQLETSGTGSGHAKWCPLCNELVAFVRDGLSPNA